MNEFEITRKYTVLHFDDYPILFVGFNDIGQIIVGSFIYEDDDENLLFFHSVVSNDLALKFLSQKITYLNLLEKAIDIYIITKDINDKIIDHKKVEFSKIDPSILPISTAYCPHVSSELIKTFYQHRQPLFVNKFFAKRTNKIKTKFAFRITDEGERSLPDEAIKTFFYSVETNKIRVSGYRSTQSYSSHFKITQKHLLNHV